MLQQLMFYGHAGSSTHCQYMACNETLSACIVFWESHATFGKTQACTARNPVNMHCIAYSTNIHCRETTKTSMQCRHALHGNNTDMQCRHNCSKTVTAYSASLPPHPVPVFHHEADLVWQRLKQPQHTHERIMRALLCTARRQSVSNSGACCGCTGNQQGIQNGCRHLCAMQHDNVSNGAAEAVEKQRTAGLRVLNEQSHCGFKRFAHMVTGSATSSKRAILAH